MDEPSNPDDPFAGIGDDLPAPHRTAQPSRAEVARKTAGFLLMGVGGMAAIPGIIVVLMLRGRGVRWEEVATAEGVLSAAGLALGLILCPLGYWLFRRSGH